MKALLICTFLAVAVLSKTIPFIDIHEPIKDAACIQKKYSHACIRGYVSYGKTDPNLVENAKKLNAVGVEVDVYMGPCFMCGNPVKQADEIMAALAQVKYTHLWVEVEGAWSSDQATNQQFLRALVAELKAKNANGLGIFTFQPTWERIVGKSFSEMSALPLWYVRLNENPEQNDFIAFGGWKKAVAKQYDDENVVCGNDVNYDSLYVN